MNSLSNANSYYQIKSLVRLMAILVGVILALRVSPFAIYAVGALVIYALKQRRPEFSFCALMLLVSLPIMNGIFFERNFHFTLVLRGSVFLIAWVMTVKAGFNRSAWFFSPFTWLFAYVGYMMIVSLSGWAPLISELKAVLFLIFMVAMIQSASAVAQSGADIRIIRSAMLVIACFFILGSLATIPFPSIGRSMLLESLAGWGISVNASELTSLFNGVTQHSQTLGPLVAMLNALLLSDYLCNFTKRQPLYWLLLAAAPVLVYMTSSRTALFSYLVSILASVFFFFQKSHVTQNKKKRILRNVLFGGILVALLLMLTPGGVDRMDAFLRKSQNVDRTKSLSEDFSNSRKPIIERAMSSFRQSPIFGNGFQVSEEMKDMDTSKAGLILSAPIEKGVLPVMILEEGGIVGALLFLCFIVTLYAKCTKRHSACFLSTFTVFIMLNSGEATFFSMSGIGGILWMICFCALLMDALREQSINGMCAFDRRTQ